MTNPTNAMDAHIDRNLIQKLLVLLLTADIFLILLDALWGAAAMANLASGRPFAIQIHQDFGIAECFNFFKWALAAYLLFTLSPVAQRYVWRPAAWAMVIMLCDDSLMLHEKAAGLSRRHLSDYFGDASNTVGELAFIALLSIAVFGLLFLCRIRATRAGKPHADTFILLMILLGVFGVGIDQIHGYLVNKFDSYLIHSIFAILENGGEMIVTSLIAVQALRIRLWASAQNLDTTS